MRSAEILALRHEAMVRTRMLSQLSAENDAELKLHLDSRARSLCPGIKAEALASLLINVRPTEKHTMRETDRIAIRSLFWSGVLSGDDPGPQFELALRRAKSGSLILRQVTHTLTTWYGSQALSKKFTERLIAYFVVAAIHIYEQAGGDPVNTQPEEESWML